MILDLQRFVREGRPRWDELEAILRRLEDDAGARLSLEEATRLHALYQRASADLSRLTTFAFEPAIRAHLEGLVGRAYGEIHRTRRTGVRWNPWAWFARDFPRAFRRHARAFAAACAITLAGGLFGAGALYSDPTAKAVLMPFAHLLGDPSERVRREEAAAPRRGEAAHASFSSHLMTHNTRVSVMLLAFGMTWGFGSAVVLFYNGVILGAVVFDYLAAGEGVFLAGWLLPHGSVEIPAFLLAGQGGLLLGGALIGWGKGIPLRGRLRLIGPDLATLIGGVAVLLVWAGIVESFFSQYHEPVLPYAVKIAFGGLQLAGLAAFLALAGRGSEEGR